MEKYEHRLFELRQYVGIVDDELMLIQHFVRGLSDHISGEVRMHEPKTLEVAMEKARIAKENLALASGGATSRKIVSEPLIGLAARGS